MTDEERELVRVASRDLGFIAREWDESVEDDSLRRSSTVLRRLLVEDLFGKAWRAVGFEKQPRLRAPELAPTIDSLDPQKILFAQAGGGRFQGAHVQSTLQYAAAMSADEIR